MIDLTIYTQPDDESCGPTSLHALYRHYGFNIELEKVIKGVERSRSGGTLAAMLGNHALAHGFSATIYVNNVYIFDPTWFDRERGEASSPEQLSAKLIAQMQHKTQPDLVQSSEAYLEFLRLGGEIRFRSMTVDLLKKYFAQKIPILTGLSATYLYHCARERFEEGKSLFDDIRGTSCGHFVVLCGYDETKKHVVVADPHRANPISNNNYYKVSSTRLINAILLGVLTYDANLLIIQPKEPFNANNNSNG